MLKTLNNFNSEILSSSDLVVLKMYANWCGPCKMLTPTMEHLSDENSDIKFYEADVDKNKDLVQQLGVSGIPLVLLFKNGTEINRIVGLKLKTDYQESINNAKL